RSRPQGAAPQRQVAPLARVEGTRYRAGQTEPEAKRQMAPVGAGRRGGRVEPALAVRARGRGPAPRPAAKERTGRTARGVTGEEDSPQRPQRTQRKTRREFLNATLFSGLLCVLCGLCGESSSGVIMSRLLLCLSFTFVLALT